MMLKGSLVLLMEKFLKKIEFRLDLVCFLPAKPDLNDVYYLHFAESLNLSNRRTKWIPAASFAFFFALSIFFLKKNAV